MNIIPITPGAEAADLIRDVREQAKTYFDEQRETSAALLSGEEVYRCVIAEYRLCGF